MERRSTLPSGIGIALQQHRESREVNDTAVTGEETPPSRSGTRGRSASDAQVFSRIGFDMEDATASTPAVTFSRTECRDIPPLSPTKDGILRDFCTGQPPKPSFLSGTPPRLAMHRRSTLANRPDLDVQLYAAMVNYEGNMFLPLDYTTLLRVTEYLNGSKPLVHVYCAFERLLINEQTNDGSAGLLMAALEQIGQYCKHLVIIAPFHPLGFGHSSDSESGNPDPGSDWEKILECFPNLQKMTFEDRSKEPTTFSQDAFHLLNYALLKNTTLRDCVEVKNNVSPGLLFAFHHDYHSRQRQRESREPLGHTTKPLAMLGSDIIYADGPEDFGPLDNDLVFGEADDVCLGDG